MLRAISRNTVPPRETSVPITRRSPEQVWAVEGQQGRSFDSTSPDAFINVDDVDRVDKKTLDTRSF
jgi:hypothetical protein